MAVIQARESNGLLNALGAIGTIGGALTGSPWLSALGMGANMMNGGGSSSGGSLGNYGNTMKDILDQIKGMWVNPASGSIAQTPGKSAAQLNDEWQKAQILQNQNPYLRSGNAWQLF